jgi:hypothetical protein
MTVKRRKTNDVEKSMKRTKRGITIAQSYAKNTKIIPILKSQAALKKFNRKDLIRKTESVTLSI